MVAAANDAPPTLPVTTKNNRKCTLVSPWSEPPVFLYDAAWTGKARQGIGPKSAYVVETVRLASDEDCTKLHCCAYSACTAVVGWLRLVFLTTEKEQFHHSTDVKNCKRCAHAHGRLESKVERNLVSCIFWRIALQQKAHCDSHRPPWSLRCSVTSAGRLLLFCVESQHDAVLANYNPVFPSNLMDPAPMDNKLKKKCSTWPANTDAFSFRQTGVRPLFWQSTVLMKHTWKLAIVFKLPCSQLFLQKRHG